MCYYYSFYHNPKPTKPIGAFGVDFSSLSEGGVSQSLDKVRRGLLQHGVTAFCPTLVTSSLDYYRKIVPLMGPRKGGKEGAAALGMGGCGRVWEGGQIHIGLN